MFIKNFAKDIKKNPASYVLLLPAALYTFIFGYLTIPYVVIAFQNFNYQKGIFGSKWVGLKNFEFFFKSSSALIVTWNTVRLNLVFIILTTVIALGLSILLNEIKGRFFPRIAQSCFILPNFISWVIISYILFSLLSTEYGMINRVLVMIGKEKVSWYSNPEYWTWILAFVKVWKDAGINTVIFLAAIIGLDGQMYEAAAIDGASRWQAIRKITIPLLLPTVAILTLISVGKLFYSDFGMIYALVKDNGLLFPTTDVIDTYVFRALRSTGNPSVSMAVGLYQSLVGFVLVFGSNWLVKKFYPEGAIY
ncbi:MAG: ABC transporter permease subunit [Ruthenibacterium sp.]